MFLYLNTYTSLYQEELTEQKADLLTKLQWKLIFSFCFRFQQRSQSQHQMTEHSYEEKMTRQNTVNIFTKQRNIIPKQSVFFMYGIGPLEDVAHEHCIAINDHCF